MSHIEGQRDTDLHHEDGSHRTTARTAKGRDVERHERRISEHLAEHDLRRLEATAPGIDPTLVAPSLESLLAGTEFADALPPEEN